MDDIEHRPKHHNNPPYYWYRGFRCVHLPPWNEEWEIEGTGVKCRMYSMPMKLIDANFDLFTQLKESTDNGNP